MPDSITILHVDDDPGLRDLVAELLQLENDEFVVHTAPDANEGLNRLAKNGQEIDCVVSDHDMPGMDGIEFLEAVRETYPDIPFILFTGKGSEEVASDAISAGASDYLQKRGGPEQYTLLANRIENAVEQYRSERQAANLERIRELVANINQTLVRATSTAEIEKKVCQLISESDPYITACIAGVNREAMQIEPRTWAGDAAGYFEQLDMAVDEDSPGRHAPGGRAFHDREMAISQNIQEDDRYESWQGAATERGFRSLAVIPLEYDGDLHGLLATFASRPSAFDETEQNLLSELGDDIAHALHAQTLQTEFKQTSDELNTILDRAPAGFILMSHDDGTFRYRRFNRRMEELSGLSSDDIRNKTPQEALGTEDGAEVVDRYRECVERREPVEYTSTFEIDGEEVIRKGVVTPVVTEGAIQQLVVVVQDVTEERRRQRRLKETTARLEALFENSPDMINIHDVDGNLIDPNPKLCEKTGYEENELRDLKVWNLDTEVEREEVSDMWNEMDVGDSRKLEGQYQRKDGSTFPVEVHIRRLDLVGEDRFVAISRDITERKETERKRRQIISRMTDAVIEVDSEWQITLVNQRTEEFSGRAESELVGQNFWDIFADARGTIFEEEYRRAMNMREQVSIVDYYPGVDEWFDIRVYPNEDSGLAFYFQTITEYKKRQQELQRIERRYNAILEDPNILTGVLDTEGRLVKQNKTAMEYIDAEMEDVVGTPFWETPWWPPDMRPVIQEKIEQAMNGEYVDYEADLTKPNGESYIVSGVIRPVTDENGEITSLVVSARDITEQKQREQESKELNQQFEYLAETVPNGLFLVSADYSEVYYCNSAAGELYGVDMNEIREDPSVWRRHVHPDDIGRIQDDIDAQKSGRIDDTQHQKFRVQHPDKGMRWLKVNIYPVKEEESVKRLAGVATDITERERRKRQLQRYEKIVETMDDIAFVVDDDWTIDFVNTSVLEYVDASLEDLTDQPIMALAEKYIAGEADQSRFEEVLERCFDENHDAGPERLELSLDVNGTSVVFEYQLSPLVSDGKITGVVITMRDITRRRHREQELKRTQERMEVALKRTKSVIWEYNPETEQVQTYPDPCPLLDQSVETFAEFREAIHPNDRHKIEKSVQTVVKSGNPEIVEYRVANDSGSEWVKAQIEPVMADDSALWRIIGVSTDITEQKHREMRLEQQNERFDELANAVSHDLQTPLATAMGRTKLAIETGETHHMEETLDALQRADDLREGLVEVLRSREIIQELESVNIGTLAETVWRTLQPPDTASLDVDDSLTVEADRAAMQRLLENLFSNSIEHGGDTVSISVGELENGFYVEDDGPGISSEDSDQVFEAGYSTKNDGDGIGMASAKEIVQAHGWTITITEMERDGARFEIHK